jgi:hypothetical protein
MGIRRLCHFNSKITSTPSLRPDVSPMKLEFRMVFEADLPIPVEETRIRRPRALPAPSIDQEIMETHATVGANLSLLPRFQPVIVRPPLSTGFSF